MFQLNIFASTVTNKNKKSIMTRRKNNMCIICIEVLGKKMSTYEGRMALVELRGGLPPGHAEDVKQLLDTLEWKSNVSRKPIDFPEDYD
jgi:hypothetical protein